MEIVIVMEFIVEIPKKQPTCFIKVNIIPSIKINIPAYETTI